VSQVCRELDGMPLAIELAAARLRSMTLPELAQRLRQRFRLLSGGRGTDPRHRSLEALVAWSFEHLSEPEQALFAKLSVFLGEFDLAAAHAIAGNPAGDDLDTLAGLDGLLEKSLLNAVERHGRTRYSMLETLRQYGEARLGAGADELRARHASYFAEVIGRVKQHATGGRGAFAELILEDFPNIRAAVQSALANNDQESCLTIVSELAPYAQLRPTLEVAEWTDAALEAAAGSVSGRMVRAHLAASSIRHYLADWAEAERHARRAQELNEQLGGEYTASALICLAPPLGYLGRVEEAASVARYGVAEAERTGRPVVLAAARAVLAHCAVYAGQDPSDADVEVLQERAERADSAVVRAYAVCNLGFAALIRGRPEAIAWLEEGCKQAEAIGHLHMTCLHRTYLELARASASGTTPLFALRVALVEYGVARIPFGPRQIAAELLHHFADLARWETVATLHGATPAVSLFPDAARRARGAARAALGAAAFERAAARGRRMLHEELEAFLHAELDTLGVPEHRPNVALDAPG
jgi:hypothetical protein